MKNLANHIQGTNEENVFEQSDKEQQSLVKEYFERNERKKDDDKWLKKNKGSVLGILEKMGKEKHDFGEVRASYTTPDTSKFDNDKIMEFLVEKGMDEMGTKRVVDEDAIANLIEQGLIDLDELKEYAWVESKGTPRLTVKKAKKSDD